MADALFRSPLSEVDCNRSLRLDNAKGVLIVLVVFGHFMEEFVGWSGGFGSSALTAIYLFHMPAFVFLAGLLSGNEGLSLKVRFFGTLLLIFHVSYVTAGWGGSGGFNLDIFRPYWVLWYLMSLMWWLVLGWALQRVRFATGISVGGALLAGFMPFDGYLLSWSRTLVFFPFFLTGRLYGKQLLRQLVATTLAGRCLIAVGVGICGVVSMSDVDHRWLYGAFNFSTLGIPALDSVVLRGVLLVASALVCAAFFCALPDRRLLGVSYIGRASLIVFLFHGFFVKLSGKLVGQFDLAGDYSGLTLALCGSALTLAAVAHPVLDREVRRSIERLWVPIDSYRKRARGN